MVLVAKTRINAKCLVSHSPRSHRLTHIDKSFNVADKLKPDIVRKPGSDYHHLNTKREKIFFKFIR